MSTYETGSGGSNSPVPSIDFDNITKAWNLTREKQGIWAGALLVMFLILLAMNVGSYLADLTLTGNATSNPRDRTAEQVTLSATLQFISSILYAAVNAFFMGGLFKMAFKQLRGESLEISDLFTGRDLFLPLWGASLLISLGVSAGMLFCLLPGLLLSGLWMFTIPLIVDKRMGVLEAMGKSFETLRPHMWSAVGYQIVVGLISALGVLLCGIGIIFTAPITYLAIAILYRQFFPDSEGYSGPRLQMPLPPTAR
jgi:uncharacterized membrane protein